MDLEKNATHTGVPTGIADLDYLTSGLQPGEVTVITGPPGVGKTITAASIACNAAVRADKTVAFFTLESSVPEMERRFIAAEARVALHHLRSGHLTDEETERLEKKSPELDKAPLYVYDTGNQTVPQIEERFHILRPNAGLDMAVIDYHGLMRASRATKDREAEIAEISRDIKALATRWGVPVIVISQRSSRPADTGGREPLVTRHSRIVEDAADLVVLLHRDDLYDLKSRRAGEMDLKVIKYRNGPLCTITVAFQGHYSRIVDIAQD